MSKVPTSDNGSDLSSDLDKKSWNHDFGVRLKKARENFGLSQIELAKKIGADKNTIQNYEAGGRPRGDYLVLISCVLNISVDDLLFGPGKYTCSEEPGPVSILQTDLLRAIIRAVESELRKRNLELAPDKKAEAIALLYEMYADTGKEVTEQTVVRCLKLVA